MDETSTTESTGAPPSAPDSSGRRSRQRVAVVVAVVVLVAGAAAVAGGRSGPSASSSAGSASEGPRSTTPAITAPGVPEDGLSGGPDDTLAGLQPPTGSGSDAASGASAPAPDVPGARPAIPLALPGAWTGGAGSSSATPNGRPAPAGDAATAGGAGMTGAAGTAVLDPVPVGKSVRVGAAVEARVDSITSARVRPRGPGDIAGPAAVVVLRLVNVSARPVDLAGLAVTATGADGAPAIPSDGKPSDVLTGSLPAGGERTGTYVFGLRGAGEEATSTAGLRLEVGLSSAPEVAVVVAR